jgi:PGF-CTERM protein
VTDDDGDGEATVEWNTFAADGEGNGNGFALADDDDELSVVKDFSDVRGYDAITDSGDIVASDIIDADSYSLAVTAGDRAELEDDGAQNVATAEVRERSLGDLRIWTAPDNDATDELDLETVNDAVGSSITQTDEVAEEDLVVFQLTEMSGLEGALTEEGSDDAFDQFIGIHQDANGNTDALEDAVSFDIEQSNPGANESPVAISAEAGLNADGGQVVADPANDTYYAVVDMQDVANLVQNIDTDDRFDVTFEVNNYSVNSSFTGLVETTDDDGDFVDEEVTDGFTFVEADATVDGSQNGLNLGANENVTVSGTTNVAPGTELTVRVESETGQESSFVRAPTVTVTPNGTYSTTVDLAAAVEGTDFTVEIQRSGNALEDVDGTITGPPEVNSLVVADQETAGRTVVVDEVNLSDGGFLAVHRGGPTGEVIGASSFIPAETTRTNVAIGLNTQLTETTDVFVMPHRDTNANQEYEFPGADGPYTVNDTSDQPAGQLITLQVGGEPVDTPTETEQPDTPTETEQPDTPTETEQPDTPTETEQPDTETETTTTTGDGSPGFGVMVSIVALVAAALLALRRRN